jgi:type IV pilus assembly protein PilC
MPTFAFRGVNQFGAIVAGRRAASNREDLIAALGRQRVRVTKVTEKTSRLSLGAIGGGVAVKEIAVFTRQLSVMIDSGLPLMQCLELLAQQQENKKFQQAIQAVRDSVEGGTTLSAAMEPFPKIFDQLFVNMVAAGEAGGILDTILLRLAVFLEKNDAIVRKVKGAMIYPAVIFSVAIIAVVVLLVFVIPTFQSMFASVNMELPLPTKIVIGMSDFLQNFWWALLVGMGLTAFLIQRYYATEGGKLVIDRLMLNAPVLGDLLRKSAVSRFTRTLGTLISSGVAILDGLEITARTAGNRVIHDAVMESRGSIAGGETIAQPLSKSGVFPPMVTSMIAVGEATGGLDEMLTKIADFYDDEVDAAVGALLSLMEPIMIVVLGVIVGGMIVAMYLPIFGMINAVQ